MKRLICCVAVSLMLLGSAHSASQSTGNQPEGRILFIKTIRDLRASFVEDRVRAMKTLGTQTDKPLIKEFGVLKNLYAIANEQGRFVIERIAALEALLELHKGNIRDSNMIKDLVAMIDIGRNRRVPISVQLTALRMITYVAGDDKVDSEFRGSAFNSLMDFWKKSKKMGAAPTKLRAQLIESLSGFVYNSSVMAILKEALDKEKSSMIRVGAIRGLTRYFEANPEADGRRHERIWDAVVKRFRSSIDDGKKGLEERIASLDCLEALTAAGIDKKPSSTLRDAILKLMKEGSDAEASKAVRFMLQIASEQVELVSDIIEVAAPNNKKHRPATIHEFSKALVEIFNRLPAHKSKTKATATAEKITKHFIKMMQYEKAPLALRQSAIFGLGTTPIDYDRQEIVKQLIEQFDRELKASRRGGEGGRRKGIRMPLVRSIEKSLMLLTGEKFVVHIIRREAAAGMLVENVAAADATLVMPDIEKWKAWYEKYKQWLVPKKSPLMLGDRDIVEDPA